MPPALLFDLDQLDLTADPVASKDDISQFNPQRYEMQQLDGILWYEETKHQILGYKDVTDSEFWIRGHIPGRPIMPGVIMIEAAAQVLSYYVKAIMKAEGFVGFGGIESAKFRSTVSPGSRLYILGQGTKLSSRRNIFATQGIADGKMIFEASIAGLRV